MSGWAFLRIRGFFLISRWTCLVPVSYFAWHDISVSTAVWKVYTITTIHSTWSQVAKSFRCSCQFHLNFVATETSIISPCFFEGCLFCMVFLFFYSPWWFFAVFSHGFLPTRTGFRIQPPPQIRSFHPPDRCAGLRSQHLHELAKPVTEIHWKTNQTSTSCWWWYFCQLDTVEDIIHVLSCSTIYQSLPCVACRCCSLEESSTDHSQPGSAPNVWKSRTDSHKTSKKTSIKKLLYTRCFHI